MIYLIFSLTVILIWFAEKAKNEIYWVYLYVGMHEIQSLLYWGTCII